MQPSVLMNRFIINLRSFSTASSSQDSSAQHWSRFSVPNFRIPDSFLGNIGEDLQHGHKSADDDLDHDQEAKTVSISQQGSSEAELVEMFVTRCSSDPRPLGTRVSRQIHSKLNHVRELHST